MNTIGDALSRLVFLGLLAVVLLNLGGCDRQVSLERQACMALAAEEGLTERESIARCTRGIH